MLIGELSKEATDVTQEFSSHFATTTTAATSSYVGSRASVINGSTDDTQYYELIPDVVPKFIEPAATKIETDLGLSWTQHYFTARRYRRRPSIAINADARVGRPKTTSSAFRPPHKCSPPWGGRGPCSTSAPLSPSHMPPCGGHHRLCSDGNCFNDHLGDSPSVSGDAVTVKLADEHTMVFVSHYSFNSLRSDDRFFIQYIALVERQ